GATVRVYSQSGRDPQIGAGIYQARSAGVLQVGEQNTTAVDVTGSAMLSADHGTVNVDRDVHDNPPGANLAMHITGGSIRIRLTQGAGPVVVGACGPIDVDPGSDALLEVNGSILQGSSGWTIGMNPSGNSRATVALQNAFSARSMASVNGPVTLG